MCLFYYDKEKHMRGERVEGFAEGYAGVVAERYAKQHPENYAKCYIEEYTRAYDEGYGLKYKKDYPKLYDTCYVKCRYRILNSARKTAVFNLLHRNIISIEEAAKFLDITVDRAKRLEQMYC